MLWKDSFVKSWDFNIILLIWLEDGKTSVTRQFTPPISHVIANRAEMPHVNLYCTHWSNSDFSHTNTILLWESVFFRAEIKPRGNRLGTDCSIKGKHTVSASLQALYSYGCRRKPAWSQKSAWDLNCYEGWRWGMKTRKVQAGNLAQTHTNYIYRVTLNLCNSLHYLHMPTHTCTRAHTAIRLPFFSGERQQDRFTMPRLLR